MKKLHQAVLIALLLTGSHAHAQGWVPSTAEISSAMLQANAAYKDFAGQYRDCTDTVFGAAQAIATGTKAEFDLSGDSDGIKAGARLGTGSRVDLSINQGFKLHADFSLLPSFSSGTSPWTIASNLAQSQYIGRAQGCAASLWSSARDELWKGGANVVGWKNTGIEQGAWVWNKTSQLPSAASSTIKKSVGNWSAW